jgi:uncharacterized membrane protein YgcG
MKCPSCATTLAAPEPRCPSCKLTLQALDVKFGALPKHAMYFTDRTDRVPLRDMAKMRALLELFHRRFPQCLFSVFVAELPRGTSVSEYAFWLANRARFSSVEQAQGENFDLLLVVDMSGRAAALNVGYGLEEYLREDDLAAALDAFTAAMRSDDMPAGVQASLDVVSERLSEKWTAMHTEPPVNSLASDRVQETWA